MTHEATEPRRSGSIPTCPWSRRFTALMLLVVCLASPLAGGAGALLALDLLVLVVFPSGSALDPHLVPLYLSAALASLLSGLIFWWRFILRSGRLTPGRGAWVGIVGSLVAHPLTWLFLVGATFLTGGMTSSYLPPNLSRFTDLLWYVVNSSCLSLLFVGWFTALVGGLVGVGVTWVLALLEA